MRNWYLPTLGYTTGIRIARIAAGDREHAGTGGGDFVLGEGGGGLGGGSCTGKDKDGDESANDGFHEMDPF
jgi:hypothetical protein